ncbi:MAG: hypothetical protein M0011_09500 [Elusimicrobia bacterium]|nr:hypothetical protein [Elusimicrobiota bacterium]
MIGKLRDLIVHKFKSLLGVYQLRDEIRRLSEISIQSLLANELNNDPRYQDKKRLTRYEFQVNSQGGEDGIIQEIFRRIGTTNKFFVEFGAGNGLENNTSCLLLNKWKGCWMECSERHADAIRDGYAGLIADKSLVFKETLINAEDIEPLFTELGVPAEFDLLSIDIDGNDYWVWKAIENYRPRVVIIEYNAYMGPQAEWTIRYDRDFSKGQDRYWGASLKLLEKLGREKGYALVGCSYIGVNAFFVREDLLKSDFAEPFTAENHYEPQKPYLIRNSNYPKSFKELSRPGV